MYTLSPRTQAMADALAARADPGAFQQTPESRAYAGRTLIEIARMCLENSGTSTIGWSRDQIAAEAMQQRSGMHASEAFPILLSNVLNKTLRAGYEAAPQTFRPLVRIATVPDFKPVTRAQLGEAPQFDKVNEHGEFQRGKIGEAGESYKIATYGKIIGLTRQSVVNDDLDAFTRIPQAFGVQAAQLESDIVWAQILANPAMGDGTALFHANHKNLGTDLAIGEAAVSEARLKMGLQTGLDGKTVLNISPTYLITSKTQQTAAEKYLAQTYPTKEADAVPASLKALTLISEPRLDNGIARYEIGGDVNAFYFASTAGAGVDLIELAYLEGAQGVYTETRMGFNVDGLEFKVRLDAGAKVLDWRGLFKTPYSG